MLIFEIEGRPISLNQIYANHWTKRSDHKITWGWAIKAALIKFKIPRSPLPSAVEIQFIFYVKRPIDVDNCAGTIKLIIDYLREWGLLQNDSPAFVRKITIEVLTQQSREYCSIIIL